MREISRGHPLLAELAAACTAADALAKMGGDATERKAHAVMLAREVVRLADLEDQAYVAREAARAGARGC